jgi:hypothetical protein
MSEQSFSFIERRARIIIGGLLILAAASCHDADPVRPSAEDVLTLTTSTRTAPADGASVVTLSASVPPDAQTSHRTVQFATTLGLLLPGREASTSRVVDAAGSATVQLLAPTTLGLSLIEARAGNVVRRDSIRFVHAYAHQVYVEATAFALKAQPGAELTATAHLRRSIGAVSAGTIVRFDARSASGEQIGQFSSVLPSDAAGRAVARFTVGSVSYRGTVDLVAIVDSAGVELRDTAVIQIIDP